MKSGDEVRIIGSTLLPNFTKGVVQSYNSDTIPIIVRTYTDPFWIHKKYIYKDKSISYYLAILLHLKSYVKYRRANKKCN